MTTPSFGGQPAQIIHPNGQTVLYLNPYTGTYTASRSYGLRMQRGYSRGLPQFEARGKPSGESRIRREQAAERGTTPWELFKSSFERRYGFSYSYWRSLRRRWVDEINRLTSKDGFGHIEPVHIQQVIQLFATGWRDRQFPELDTWQAWVENSLDLRLENMIAYQEYGEINPGRQRWLSRSSNPPIEFYYYH